jgi:DNA polymerase III subunit delta
MIYQITSEKDIERLREKSKNCIVIVGGEPVITNQTLSICKKYFETINFGLETISLDLNTTISDLGPIFSDGSLFNNSTLYNISLVTGKISDNVKTTITHSISNRIGDFFIVNVKTDSKDFKKSTWFRLLEKISLVIEASEPNPAEIIEAIKNRSRFHGVSLTEEATSLIAELSEGSLLTAENEIIKLSLMNNDEKVDVIDISNSISNGSKYDSFQLLDCCFHGKIAETHKVIGYLEEEGVEPLLINGLYAWLFRAILNIKISKQGGYSQDAFAKFRVYGTSQKLVINGAAKMTHRQIEASMNKIRDIDLICKGLLVGNPWLELNRFVTGLSRILNKSMV